jgi:hypothetical protein
MKKALILLFATILLGGTLNVQETRSASPEDLFEEWENEFNDLICNIDECENPTDPDPTPTPTPNPETTTTVETEFEYEVHYEAKSRKDSKCEGSIGNLVWNDENGNGLQDNGEKGIDDVKMTLKWVGEDYKWDTKDDEEMTTHTNKNGKYEFDDLCEGDYKIEVKEKDVTGYTQVYDPDGKPNHKAKVYLDGDRDEHTKADFGYAHRSTPATGSGMIALFVAGIISLLSLVTFKQLRRKLY